LGRLGNTWSVSIPVLLVIYRNLHGCWPPSDVEMVEIVAAGKTTRRARKRRRRVRCFTCGLHFPPLAYVDHNCSDEEGEGRRKERLAKETVILNISDSDAE
jgi:hypothetical protein